MDNHLNRNKSLNLMEGLTAVVIVGLIGLFMGFFSIFNENVADTSRVTVNVINESIVPINTGDELAGASDCDPTSFTINSVANGSTITQIISSGNYSVTTTGLVVNSSDTVGSDYWLANYTYTRGGPACNITTSVNTEFENQTDIVGLVLLAVFFGIAISALIGSFLVRLISSRRI